jgi:hypothetical protein
MANLPQPTLALFGDRCGDAVAGQPGRALALDLDEPAQWLLDILATWGITVHAKARAAPRFFLNYRSGDGDAISLMLHNELSSRFSDADVFRDNNSIPPGEPFPEKLLAGARGCRAMLSLIGPRWESMKDDNGGRLIDRSYDWVRREILEAWEHGEPKTVIPVLLGTRRPLRTYELPPCLQDLATAQYLELDAGAGKAEVADLVDRLLALRPDLYD